jgi:chloride channel 7
LHDFPFFIILGALGGLLGAFFIFVNYSINKLRKKVLTTKWLKVFEVVGLVFLTATIIYLAPLIIKNDCLDSEEGHLEADYIAYLCKDKEYNPLATFLFNPEGSVIKAFLN